MPFKMMSELLGDKEFVAAASMTLFVVIMLYIFASSIVEALVQTFR